MSWLRFSDRRSAQRLAVVDDYRFPAGVRHRFTVEHGDLDTAAVILVEDATRQWFRLAVRHPKAKLSMPSVVVDSLWHEMVLNTRDYAEFCDAAFGHFLHHVPESAMIPAAAAANRTTRLADTFHLAQEDESCRPEVLPLLFRVDRELEVKDGRHYLADCGGRGECYDLPGAICLQHVTGMDKPRRRGWNHEGGPPMSGWTDASGAGIGGCGGGGS
jgi:hypothetical protein